MSLGACPATSWSFLVFGVLGIASLSIAIGQLVLAWVDVESGYQRLVDTRPLAGVTGQVLRAPAVFWLAIPALGVAADVIQAHRPSGDRVPRPPLTAIGGLSIAAFAAYGQSYLSRGVASVGGRSQIDYSNANLVMAFAATALLLIVIARRIRRDQGIGERGGAPAVRAARSVILLLVVAAGASLIAIIQPIIGFIDSITGAEIPLPEALHVNETTFHSGISALVYGASVLGVISAIQHWGQAIWKRSGAERINRLSVFVVTVGGAVWGVGHMVGGFATQPALPEFSRQPSAGEVAANVLVLIGVAGVLVGVALTTINVVLNRPAGGAAHHAPQQESDGDAASGTVEMRAGEPSRSATSEGVAG